MSRARYEPVPQRDEIIILDSISSPSYNYNTGISSSASSIVHSLHNVERPPSIPASIPNSPPPSFHTHSSPGTPRPTPSTTASADYAELWGVAPSTIGAETTVTGTDALATIAKLKSRVERLEESIGRLLLEKEQNASIVTEGGGKNHRDNCCVTFVDASPDLEHALTRGSGSNCCVQFKSSKTDARIDHARRKFLFVMVIFFMICVMVVAIVAVRKGDRGPLEGHEFGDKE